jgi:hypothetical protein
MNNSKLFFSHPHWCSANLVVAYLENLGFLSTSDSCINAAEISGDTVRSANPFRNNVCAIARRWVLSEEVEKPTVTEPFEKCPVDLILPGFLGRRPVVRKVLKLRHLLGDFDEGPVEGGTAGRSEEILVDPGRIVSVGDTQIGTILGELLPLQVLGKEVADYSKCLLKNLVAGNAGHDVPLCGLPSRSVGKLRGGQSQDSKLYNIPAPKAAPSLGGTTRTRFAVLPVRSGR